MSETTTTTGWHVHDEGWPYPWVHTDAEKCYLTDTPRPVVVLDPADPTVDDLIALARRIVAQTDSCTCPDEPHQNALHDLAHDLAALASATEGAGA